MDPGSDLDADIVFEKEGFLEGGANEVMRIRSSCFLFCF